MTDDAAFGDGNDNTQPPADRFENLTGLRTAHLTMLGRQTPTQGRPITLDAAEVQEFLQRAQATGAVMSDPDDRGIAQRIIDFWNADLIASERGETVHAEMISLAPFTPPAPEGETPIRRDSYSKDAALQYIRVSSIARQWRDTRSNAYLLSGDALVNARQFDRDADIAKLIAASAEAERQVEQRHSRNKNRLIVLMTLVIIALAGLSFLAESARRSAVDENRKADLARIGEADARKIAEDETKRANEEAANSTAAAAATLLTAGDLQKALEQSTILAASREEQRAAAQARLAELEARQRLLDLAITAIVDQMAARMLAFDDVSQEIHEEVIANIGARLRSGDLQLDDFSGDVIELIIPEFSRAASDMLSPDFDSNLSGFRDAPFGPEFPLSVLPTLPDDLHATAYAQGARVPYLNYSLVLDAQRRFAIYAAANLDRTQRVVLPGGTVQYERDPRLPTDVQPDPAWYLKECCQIGQLVGRNDIAWGPDGNDAGLVDRLVNVYPNTVPIRVGLTSDWDSVSGWVQTDHNPSASRVVILSGPVFQADAVIGAPPAALWKIAISVDDQPQKQSIGRGFLIADAFLVGDPVDSDDGTPADPERFRTTVAEIARRTGLIFPTEIVTADRGVALLNRSEGDVLAALVPALDGPVAAERRALAQQLVNAVRDGAVAQTDQAKVVAALIESLQHVSDLSATGRLNLLYVLSQVPPASWNRADWLTLKATARRAVADLKARETAGQTAIGPNTRGHLNGLWATLGLNKPLGQTVYLQFAELTRDRARNLLSSLGALGWTLPREERVETATGLRQVRYNPANVADAAAARLLAADLEALGWIGARSVPVKVIREGILEIWVGSP